MLKDIFNGSLRAEADRVRAYAERPAHWYRGVADAGNGSAYALEAEGYRVLFTWSIGEQVGVIRHMSVIRRSPTNQIIVPEPHMAYTFGSLLGFTGATKDENGVVWECPSDWRYQLHTDLGFATLLQLIASEDLPA